MPKQGNIFNIPIAAGILWKLNLGIFLKEYVQPNASQVATMMALWKMITMFRSSSWNFSFTHYVTSFVRQGLQIFTEKVTSVSRNKLEKNTFLWFLVNSSKKSAKFFCSGYYFPSHISPLISSKPIFCPAKNGYFRLIWQKKLTLCFRTR